MFIVSLFSTLLIFLKAFIKSLITEFKSILLFFSIVSELLILLISDFKFEILLDTLFSIESLLTFELFSTLFKSLTEFSILEFMFSLFKLLLVLIVSLFKLLTDE